jgi:hypothetical protein
LSKDLISSLHVKNYEQPRGVPVAHTCNSNYLGGRDQEDHSLKPAGQIGRHYLKKNSSQKRTGGVPQGVKKL